MIEYSVITPVYNRADCILRCLESVASTSEAFDYEHIVVDDGSTDNTAEIIEEYSRINKKVKFIRFTQNKGTNAARNAAIKAAKGKWCIILDSDDYFVKNALNVIHKTISLHTGFMHYMFAADDMVKAYKENALIKGQDQCEFSYQDFLEGKVSGDFVHACNTEILLKHPFNEELRIYEGLFFLMFFRDAKRMLFTNTVVTVRERNRADSVTRDTIRTNNKVCERSVLSDSLFLLHFHDDLKRYGLQDRLKAIHTSLLDNLLLLGRYDDAKEHLLALADDSSKKTMVFRFVYKLRLGWLYNLMLRTFLTIRYTLNPTLK